MAESGYKQCIGEMGHGTSSKAPHMHIMMHYSMCYVQLSIRATRLVNGADMSVVHGRANRHRCFLHKGLQHSGHALMTC